MSNPSHWLELIQVFEVHSVRQLRVLSLGNSLILGQYANPSQDYTPGSVCVPILPINSERRDEKEQRETMCSEGYKSCALAL